MKKIFSIILMFTFMINIQAATAIKNYDESVDVTKEYINDFEDNSKYIILKGEMNIPFIFKNGKVEYSSTFDGNGGLLNEEEYGIGKGYLYNGLNFWLVSDSSNYKIVGTKSDIENKNKTEEYGIRVTEFVKNTARVTGEGTRLNPWEFAKRQFEVQLKVENGIVDAVNLSEYSMLITEGDTDSTTVTGKTGYAFDSVSCTNSQNAEYENGKIRIKSIFANTECTVKFVNPGQTLTYKEEEQTYDVKYSGYYEIDAYGAQGNGSGGKGGHTYGKVYLEKGTKLIINTGGQNGYNGGGSGYYSGGGATTVKIFENDLMISAGGGGGKSGTAGGNGDSLGGESVGAGAGSDGTNRGGGGSGYNYSYNANCSDCYTGENTCKGGTISYNCSDCHTGENTCVAGTDSYNCSSCYTGHNTCVDKVETTSECETWTRTYGDHFTGYNYYSCVNGKWSYSGASNFQCTGRNPQKTYSCPTKSGSCTAGSTTTVNCEGQCSWEVCSKYKTKTTKCATGENTCEYGCDTKPNSCKTGHNTCAYGCDSYYSSCKTGHNTCKYGCDTITKPYNSGHGGSNLLSDKLEDSKSESGKNAGNGKVVISYYGEKL